MSKPIELYSAEWTLMYAICNNNKNHLGDGEGDPPGRNADWGENLTILQIYETTSVKRMGEKGADLSNGGDE